MITLYDYEYFLKTGKENTESVDLTTYLKKLLYSHDAEKVQMGLSILQQSTWIDSKLKTELQKDFIQWTHEKPQQL